MPLGGERAIAIGKGDGSSASGLLVATALDIVDERRISSFVRQLSTGNVETSVAQSGSAAVQPVRSIYDALSMGARDQLEEARA